MNTKLQNIKTILSPVVLAGFEFSSSKWPHWRRFNFMSFVSYSIVIINLIPLAFFHGYLLL